MRRSHILLISIAVLTLCSVVFVGMVGPAVAGSDNSTDSEMSGSAEIDLDEDTRIVSTSYNESSEELTVTLENIGEERTSVMLVEIIERGSGSMEFRSITIQAGETRTVTLAEIEDHGGDPAVMAATERSLEDQRIEWITTGESRDPTSVSITQGVLIGVLTMGVTSSAMAYRRLTKDGDAPEAAFDERGGFR